MFDTKFIIFNTKPIILNTKLINVNTKFIILYRSAACSVSTACDVLIAEPLPPAALFNHPSF